MRRNKKSNVPLILAALAVAAGGFYYVKRKRDKERVQLQLDAAAARRLGETLFG